MLYHAFDAMDDFWSWPRSFAEAGLAASQRVHPTLADSDALRKMAAGCELFSRMRLTHSRPDFGIRTVRVHDKEVAIREEVAHSTPFCNLVHFAKQGITGQPRVLVAAPMSGHFATLLRDTIRTMLPDHDVFVTDWRNARDVPLARGVFGLDDYVHDLIAFLEAMGPASHLVAICQPCVAALVATAVMAEQGNPAQPASLTLMAGPIDTRVNPTEVNRLATGKPIEWFERQLIHVVPCRYPGSGRRVYPGFVQLAAFVSMNMPRHTKAFGDLYEYILAGEDEKAEAIRSFYEEYFAVCDLPAEFFLETVNRVFQEYELPLGKMTYRLQPVNPAAIRRTALLTVEGERDDICAIGQTVAAHDLCSGIRPYLKNHHIQTGVGHYGVFSGRRWNAQIYPRVREMIYNQA
jgi:poly(3-hydroxybutyrate) depolymerase